VNFPLIESILAFFGGALGAAMGGFYAFMLCGAAAIIGSVIMLFTGNPAFNNLITWGPFFGPNVAFAGGVAAAAYAAHAGKLDNGRDVVATLFRLRSMRVLAVGGLFGCLGFLLKFILDLASGNGHPWLNSIALSITINGIIIRLLFGKSGLFGKKGSIRQDYMPPCEPLKYLLISLGVAAFSAFLSKVMPSALGLAFGITSVSLILNRFSLKVPVTLHVAWSTEYIVFLTGNILGGIMIGLLSAILAEVFASVLLQRGDTHIDPPAISIAFIFALYPLIANAGCFSLPAAYTAIMLLIVIAGGYFGLRALWGKRGG